MFWINWSTPGSRTSWPCAATRPRAWRSSRRPPADSATPPISIAFIRKRYGRKLCLGGAGYPEGHLECRDIDRDIRNLKAKVDAGLDFIVTQLFFDNRFYFDFVARARAAGIGIPIVPGLMPIRTVAGIERMTALSGASLPAPLKSELDRSREDEAATLSLGIAQTTAQAVELLHGGAPGIHFYTLNQSPATRMILTALKTARLA